MGSAAYDLCGGRSRVSGRILGIGSETLGRVCRSSYRAGGGGHVEPFREDRGIAILAGNAGIVEKMKEYIS